MNLLPIIIRALHVRGINDKVTFPGITSSIGPKFRIHFGPGKKAHLFGPSGTKQSPSTNGGPASHRRPSLSNACFVT